MGYDPNECDRQLTQKQLQICGKSGPQGPNWEHCIDFNDTPAHATLCPDPSSQHIYDPVNSVECYNKRTGEIHFTSIDTILNECMQLKAKDPDWDQRMCWCCCSCFAFGTPIATPAGMKAIEDFAKGDEVLVATEMAISEGQVQLTWSPKTVAFSSGTGPDSSQASMVYIRYGENSGIVVTPDHVFLMPNGKLKRADRLVPDQDQLVLAEGGTTPIHEVRTGAYKGGIHHISTDLSFDGKIEGHLVNANNIVCADYLLQIHLGQMGEDVVVENHSALPKIGTPEYAARHTHLTHMANAAVSATNPLEDIVIKEFKPHKSQEKAIPDNAKLFITPEQEADIIANPKAEKQLLTETIGISAVSYLTKLYNAFYPDVRFHLEWEDIHINAYAYHDGLFNDKIVYISGGLVRIVCLNMEAMALILAQQIGYFYGTPEGAGDLRRNNIPTRQSLCKRIRQALNSTLSKRKSPDGLATRGEADYYGVLAVTRKAFFADNWFDVVMKGLSQLQTFFGYITEDNQKGEDGNPDNPSIDCRIQTMQVAISGGSLPPCAGGVVPHQLQVVSATVAQDNPAQITVTFNKAVDKKAAEDTAHYNLRPDSTIESAQLNEDDPKQVILRAILENDTDYVLTVSRITTTDGSTLDPSKTTAKFKTQTIVSLN